MFHDFAKQIVYEILEANGSLAAGEELPTIEGNSFVLAADDVEVTVFDQSPGVYLYAILSELPTQKTEELFTKLLQGNFLGQATYRASLGLDEEGRNIVISRYVAMIQGYREFHDIIEDFMNAVSFWKDQINGIQKNEKRKGGS